MSSQDSIIGAGFLNALANASSGSGAGSANRSFPTPWLDYSTVAVPDTHEMVMWWAQYLWLTDGNFRTAMERVAAHFVTTIEFPDLEPGEESQWKELFHNHMNYRRELMSCAYDYLAYGNLFVSIYLPFQRFVKCAKCGLEEPIERVEYKINFTSADPYIVWYRVRSCARCSDTAPYIVFDRRIQDLDRVKLNRYDPADIELAQNRFSLRKDIYWRIPQEDRQDILSKARIHIDDTPLEVLEAAAVGGKFQFEREMILHCDEPNISGIHSRGWGIPRSISNFRTAWLQQLTNKLDQSIAIDYTLGMRILSPHPTQGGEDPMQYSGMENFSSRIQSMVNEHRTNPASYHVAPFPLGYQFLGGEGKDLLTPDKLKFRQQEYLNQLGVPLEYHQMNLQVQAAPMALRMFEAYWQAIPSFYDRILDWVVKLMSRVYGLPVTKVQMQKTTIADDMERKAVLLQLMSANQLSPQTALQPFGIDAHEEVKRVFSHQDYVERTQAEHDEVIAKREEMGALKGMTAQPTPMALAEQQQQQAAGGVDPAAQAMNMGGMPAGGVPGPQSSATSLTGMSDQAMSIAQQLAVMPEYNRKQELKALREGNKDLHALVTQNLRDIRQQASSAGQQMLLSGGGPPQ